MDGQADLESPTKAALVYPFAAPPARGRSIEVAPGVHWIRMPLPYALNHINLWVARRRRRLGDRRHRRAHRRDAAVWRELFATRPTARPLTRVFVTHMHPDHVGMAGWLTRKFGVRLWMTRLEYLTCRVHGVRHRPRGAATTRSRFYRRAGWSDAGDRDLPRALRQLRQAHPCAARQLPAPARRRGIARSARTPGASSSAAAIRPSTPACTARARSC